MNALTAVQVERIERWMNSSVADANERQTIQRKLAVVRNLLPSGHAQALRTLAQLTLDVSWFVESAVIDGQFAPHSLASLDDVCASSAELDQLAALSGGDDAQATPLLDHLLRAYGDELCEALHWRRGALVYMFCATATKGVGDGDGDRDRMRALLAPVAPLMERAVHEFLCMLYSRRALWDADAEPSEHDVARLSAVGVFGDVSILCLMYAAELSYWFARYCSADAAGATPTTLPFRGLTMDGAAPLPAHPWLPAAALTRHERAVWLLRRFLLAVSVLPAPVRESWQTDRAQLLLSKLA
jgi:hypothetical protein